MTIVGPPEEVYKAYDLCYYAIEESIDDAVDEPETVHEPHDVVGENLQMSARRHAGQMVESMPPFSPQAIGLILNNPAFIMSLQMQSLS